MLKTDNGMGYLVKKYKLIDYFKKSQPNLKKHYLCGKKLGGVSRKNLTMKDFAAIDFETANYNRSSVCSVGIVRELFEGCFSCLSDGLSRL